MSLVYPKYISAFVEAIANFLKTVPKLSIFSLAFYLIYRQLPFKNKLKLLYKHSPLNTYIAERMTPLKYRPTFYLPTCLSQMLFHAYSTRPEMKFKREYIKVKDGGVFSMDWVIPKGEKGFDKLLVILHGLTGGTETGYMREIIDGFLNQGGYNIVVVHNRGINDTPLFTPVCFHASFTGDLKLALEIVKSRFPEVPCYTLGVSMGANIFLKLLANDEKMAEYVKCFVSVSNPLNILEGEWRNRGTIIDTLLKSEVSAYVLKHSILKKVNEAEYEQVPNFRYYYEIDDKFVLKIFKQFSNRDEYYLKSSSCYDIGKLKVPTLLINSSDDLLSTPDLINLKHFETNDNVMMILTETGGHVCWYEGIIPKRWFIDKCVRYVESVHSFHSSV